MINKLLAILVISVAIGASLFVYKNYYSKETPEVLSLQTQPTFWMVLHRKSNMEFLYLGKPGQKNQSQLIKTFVVKSGIPGEKPTPLPRLLGRAYWIITGKMESADNPETAPYFLTLDVPVTENWPYGPIPYAECGGQCDWEVPGYFGLHGVNGDATKLSQTNPGSSGCIRHSDQDITLLYNLLDPDKAEIRYYVEDI